MCLLPWLVALSVAQPPKGSVTVRRDAITVRVFLQEPTIPLGGIFILRVQVTAPGDLTGNAVQFALPEAWSDRVIQLNYTSDKQTFERNGRLWSTLTYTYRLAPLRVGHIRLDGLQITALRERFSIPPIEGVVLSGTQPEPTEPEPSGPPVRVNASVAPRQPFVGEQVVYTMEFAVAASAHLVRNPTYDPPTAEGFWAEEFPEVARAWRSGYEIQRVRLALFPLRAGQLTVGSARVNVRMEGVAGSEVLTTPPLQVVARPLPSPAPAGFQNLVGQLKVSLRVQPQQATVGDTVVVRLRLEGTANLRNLAQPPRLSLTGARVGLPRERWQVRERDGRLWFQREFEWRVVPLQAGTLTIPPFAFPYFDPAVGRYRTATTSPVRIAVFGGRAEAVSTAQTPPTPSTAERIVVVAPLVLLVAALVLVLGTTGWRYWQRQRWLAAVPVPDPQLRQTLWTFRQEGANAFHRAVRAWLREQIFQRTGILLAPNDPPERVQQLLQSKGVSETAARFVRDVWERTATVQSPDEAVHLLRQAAETPNRL